MGHSLAVTPAGGTGDRSPDVAEVLDEESGVQSLLEALGDRDCRCILDATGDDALSANEIADACNLPLSTTYRKLDLLTDTGLLDERTRIRRSGKHASEYACAVETVVVSFDDGTVELAVSRGPETPSQAPFSLG
ncbi:MAG: helix-turn-helix domain-containing protein [Haloarculaceae archaeon]